MRYTLLLALAALGIAHPSRPELSEQARSALVRRNAAPISSSAVSLIETLEGFNGSYYYIQGHKTIGFGHDCVELGCSNVPTPPITRAQGVQLLMSDLPQFESCVCGLPNSGGLNANQYGALVSFTYNAGCGNTRKYFRSYMSSKNYAGICSALPNTLPNGNRRPKEAAFCNQATSALSGCNGAGASSSPAHSTAGTSAQASSSAAGYVSSSASATSAGYPTSIGYVTGGSTSLGYGYSAGSTAGGYYTAASSGGGSYGGSTPSYGGGSPAPSYGGGSPAPSGGYGGSS